MEIFQYSQTRNPALDEVCTLNFFSLCKPSTPRTNKFPYIYKVSFVQHRIHIESHIPECCPITSRCGNKGQGYLFIYVHKLLMCLNLFPQFHDCYLLASDL